MMLYHCVGNVDPIKEGIIRCLENDGRPGSIELCKVKKLTYDAWRGSKAAGYSSSMLTLESKLFIYLHDNIKSAIEAAQCDYDKTVVIGCDSKKMVGEQKPIAASFGDKNLVSDDTSDFDDIASGVRIVPFELPLKPTLRRIICHPAMQADVEDALRSSRLTADLFYVEPTPKFRFVMYDSNGKLM